MAKKRKSNFSQSVYAPGQDQGEIETHTLSILAENQPGVMAKIIGLFAGRGYNIDTLTAAETDHDNNLSRLTIVTSGVAIELDQIKNQLESLVPVRSVRDLTTYGPHVDRELALVKVVGDKEQRVEALRIADVFRARAVDSTLESFVFEVTGASEKVDAFIKLMRPLGMIDVSRSGVAAISRGKTAIGDD